jgi:hypothetical protein
MIAALSYSSAATAVAFAALKMLSFTDTSGDKEGGAW